MEVRYYIHKKSKSDKKVFQYIEQLKNIDMN